MSQNTTIGLQTPIQKLTDSILTVNEKVLAVKEILDIPSIEGTNELKSSDKMDFLIGVVEKIGYNLDDITRSLSKL